VAKRLLTAGVVLGVLLVVYLGARQRLGRTPIDVPLAEQDAVTVATTSPIARPAPEDDGEDVAERSLEERSTGIKQMIGKALASGYRDRYIETLVGEGLSRADSENIVQTLFNALAECHFAVTRQRYESYGLTVEQFLSGAEEVWTARDYHNVSVDTIARNAPQCVAQASQQAGLPIAIEPDGSAAASAPEDFGILAQPNLVAWPRSADANVGPQDWAHQMESTLRAHIDRYSDASLTDLRIKCEERGCVVLMKGEMIPIFEFEFDRFAEENGFASALAGGDASRRIVWLWK
jgi:hypothetical protein